MSHGNCTFTIRACGDRDQAQSDIDIVVAALKAAGWLIHGEPEAEPYGPDAVDAPTFQNNGPVCTVTFPNFVPVEGVTYQLWKTEDDWETHSVETDNVTPNDPFETTWNENTKFRIVILASPDPVYGPSTTNEP